MILFIRNPNLQNIKKKKSLINSNVWAVAFEAARVYIYCASVLRSLARSLALQQVLQALSKVSHLT
jgi:hypothetical protein